VQVSNIVNGAVGAVGIDDKAAGIYQYVSRQVAHEHGIASLTPRPGDPAADVHACLRTSQDTLVWLDVVELTFRLIEAVYGDFNEHALRARGVTISRPKLPRS
jgi:hypothetical protein